jgi:asparagine synthase (glutamine-hydrolysing)/putative beta-lactam synthetase
MSITGWIDFTHDLTNQQNVSQMFATLQSDAHYTISKYTTTQAAIAGTTKVYDEGSLVVETSDEHTIAVTYAGSINNTQALQKELTTLGYVSASNAGSSILIQAYRCWGKDFVKKLIGAFAIAVWDEKQQKLLLYRDRMGIKPIYYTEIASGILFGSAPKSIMANELFQPTFEAEALQILLQPRLTLPGETPIKDFYEIPPAHVLEYSSNRLQLEAYWALESKPHTDSFEETAQKVRAILEEIVDDEMRANRNVGAMLSGGLDSTSVAALLANSLAKNGEAKLNTYCVDFTRSEDFASSELRPDIDAPYAQEAADHMKTNHTTLAFSVDDILNAIPATRTARDLPAWGQFDASMYSLFSKMKVENNLAFSGEGADEFFGGYPYLFNEELTMGNTFPWMGKSLRLSSFLAPEITAYFDPIADEAKRYEYLLSKVPKLAGEAPKEARMREVLYLGMSGPLQVIIDRKDKMSSALGLDMRIPFCDHRLVQYVWNIPWELKTTGGLKGLLKKAVEDIVPESTLKRKKSAYPHNQDDEYEAGLISEVKQILDDETSTIPQLFDVKKLKDFIAKMETNSLSASDFPGGSSPAYMLVHIIELDTWIKNYNVKFIKKC